MEAEGLGDGDGAMVAELGIVIKWVSNEGMTSEIGMKAAVNPSTN